MTPSRFLASPTETREARKPDTAWRPPLPRRPRRCPGSATSQWPRTRRCPAPEPPTRPQSPPTAAATCRAHEARRAPMPPVPSISTRYLVRTTVPFHLPVATTAAPPAPARRLRDPPRLPKEASDASSMKGADSIALAPCQPYAPARRPAPPVSSGCDVPRSSNRPPLQSLRPAKCPIRRNRPAPPDHPQQRPQSHRPEAERFRPVQSAEPVRPAFPRNSSNASLLKTRSAMSSPSFRYDSHCASSKN